MNSLEETFNNLSRGYQESNEESTIENLKERLAHLESLFKKIAALEARIEALEDGDEGEMSIAQAVQIQSLAQQWGVRA